jgi:outer membrane protein assembly factor BamB
VAGCAKDTDCRGQRICDKGSCVDPQPGSAALRQRPCTDAPEAVTAGGEAPGIVKLASRTRELTRLAVPGTSAGGRALAAGGPMFRGGPSHPGRSPHAGPDAKPKERWRFRTGGAIFSTPLVSPDGKTVYVGSHDRHVYAVNTKDGTLRWRHATGERVWSSPALGQDGTLYVGSDDDHVYALAQGGKVRWSFALGPCQKAKVGPEATRCDADSSPTIGPGGTIYFGGDAVYALKPDHALGDGGKPRWAFVVGEDVDASPAIDEAGVVYFGADDHRLIAVNPDGRLRWAVATLGDVRSSPAIGQDGTVVVGSFDGRVYAVRPDGSVKWVYSTGKHIHASPLIDRNGIVYVGSQDGRVHAINQDGTLRWAIEVDAEVDASPVLGPDGTLYVGADDGWLRAYR